MPLTVPKGYKSALTLRETERAIKTTRVIFEDRLTDTLTLERVSAPLFVTVDSGINDDLNGVERAVDFDIPAVAGDAVIVHSLAKWKRMALYNYGFVHGTGLYTNMNAIRRDEELDNLHSVYVDQWDWERVISRSERTEEFLRAVVTKIVSAICDTALEVKAAFPALTTELSRNILFITTQQLLDMYPDASPKEREDLITREHPTVCLMKIGDRLSDGRAHDGRAPDYDDWALNCDIIFRNEVLDAPFEISSMGIRVDSASLLSQLRKSGCEDRLKYDYHRMIADGTLPLTIGGGIGQSRLCMLLLQKAHIGEVQASVWDEDMRKACREAGIELL
ncbi:MAG: aspartate--ammonia ligase [Clostridia bacterium]|nr:aspartate--ammonia ligase [Clostridia bacterium]